MGLRTRANSYRFVERVNCPACHSPATEALFSSAFADPPISAFIESHYRISPAVLGSARYELMHCTHCGLFYQRWIGDAELLSELYGVWVNDHVIPSDDPTYQQECTHFNESRDAHEIIAAASFIGVPISRMRTLDYGMGWALWARIAKSLGCDSFGSDLSPSRMDYAREHGIGALRDDQIGKFKFHFINTEQVMEHLAQPLEAAARLASALMPRGILKISVPSGENVDATVSRLDSGTLLDSVRELTAIEPLEHINCFTKSSLVQLAHSLGLQMVRPRLRDAYAFLSHPGGLSLLRPKKAAKELIRPIYQFRSPSNLYVWMQKT